MDSPFLQGFQVGSGVMGSALDRNLRIQQLRSQDAMRRVQEENAAKELAMKMQEFEMRVQRQADTVKAFAQMQAMSTPFLPGPNGQMIPNPARVPTGTAMLMTMGRLAESPEQLATMAAQGALINEREKEEQQRTFNPMGESVTLPGGDVIEGVRTSPNQFTPVIKPSITQVPNPATGGTTPLLRTGLNSARPVPQDIGERQKAQFDRQQKAKMVDWVREKRPDMLHLLRRDEAGDLTVPDDVVEQVSKLANIPNPTRDLMAQQELGAENVFAVGRRFLPLINSQTVGPSGWWKREVVAKVPFVDKVFGTEGVSDAVAAETVGKQFLGQIFKTLRSDSNINQAEYEQIRSAAPDPTLFLTKPEGEKRKLYEFLVNAATVSRNNAVRSGRAITPMFLTKQELMRQTDLFQQTDGSQGLSSTQAAQLWENSATALVQQLKTELGIQ